MQPQIAELINRLKPGGLAGLATLSDEDFAAVESILINEDRDRIEALFRQEKASFDVGPLVWLTKYTKTENPQYEQLGVPFLAPFPQKSYFIEIFRAFFTYDKLFIPKSRTMMTSWSAAAFACWAAQWKGEETIFQATNEDRAMHLVDYVRQLVDYQEPWISQRHPIAKRSLFAIAWKGGGEVAAIPAGADAIRAFHPTRYIQDESAFMAEGEEALNAVIPTRAKIICISTASPGWFGDQCSL